MARHFQITQKNKFAISLQYLTKEVSDEVDFFHAEEHEGFLQINTMFLVNPCLTLPLLTMILGK